MTLPQSLHTSWRKQYTRPTSIKSYRNQSVLHSTSTAESKTLRSCESPFDLRKDCLFCGDEASMTVQLGSKRRKSVTNVETTEFRENILKRATERNDEFGQTVSTQVGSCIDLITVKPCIIVNVADGSSFMMYMKYAANVHVGGQRKSLQLQLS